MPRELRRGGASSTRPTCSQARNSNGVYFPRIGEEGIAQRLFADTKPADSVPTDPLDAGEIGILDLPTAERFKLPIAKLTNGVGQPVVALERVEPHRRLQRHEDVSPAGFHSMPAVVTGPNAYPLTKVDQAMVPKQLDRLRQGPSHPRVPRLRGGPRPDDASARLRAAPHAAGNADAALHGRPAGRRRPLRPRRPHRSCPSTTTSRRSTKVPPATAVRPTSVVRPAPTPTTTPTTTRGDTTTTTHAEARTAEGDVRRAPAAGIRRSPRAPDPARTRLARVACELRRQRAPARRKAQAGRAH